MAFRVPEEAANERAYPMELLGYRDGSERRQSPVLLLE
jgi:hypothetical protein